MKTYVWMAGRWVYAYQSIDELGQVIDVYLSETRDTAAAGSNDIQRWFTRLSCS